MNKPLMWSTAIVILIAGGSASAHSGLGPGPVNLGAAGTFPILSKSGITDAFPSVVTGGVRTTPITGAALLLSCGEMTGKLYTFDAAGPLPCAINDASFLGMAVGDMEFAADDAAGRVFPDFTELGAVQIVIGDPQHPQQSTINSLKSLQ